MSFLFLPSSQVQKPNEQINDQNPSKSEALAAWGPSLDNGPKNLPVNFAVNN